MSTSQVQIEAAWYVDKSSTAGGRVTCRHVMWSKRLYCMAWYCASYLESNNRQVAHSACSVCYCTVVAVIEPAVTRDLVHSAPIQVTDQQLLHVPAVAADETDVDGQHGADVTTTTNTRRLHAGNNNNIQYAPEFERFISWRRVTYRSAQTHKRKHSELQDQTANVRLSTYAFDWSFTRKTTSSHSPRSAKILK